MGEFEIDNGYRIEYENPHPPPPMYESIIWGEIDPEGSATGLAGDVVLSPDNNFGSGKTIRELIMEDFYLRLLDHIRYQREI